MLHDLQREDDVIAVSGLAQRRRRGRAVVDGEALFFGVRAGGVDARLGRIRPR
jgi:hypothetical protein